MHTVLHMEAPTIDSDCSWPTPTGPSGVDRQCSSTDKEGGTVDIVSGRTVVQVRGHG